MLGERIANLRKSKGISQEELADILLTSRQAVSKWERGESDPDIERLKDIAIYFNVSIDYLLGYDIASTSVTNFINRMKKCDEENNYDISLDEIRSMVNRNQNNYHLIIEIIKYLSNYYGFRHEIEAVDLIIEYSQKAIVLYQPAIDEEYSLNDLHQVIVNCYTVLERYDLAKAYIKDNRVHGLDVTLAECECELDNDVEAEKMVSTAYLKAVSTIVSCSFIQIRLFLRTKKNKDALDLTNWSLDFVKSIGRNNELFFDIIYILNFIKAYTEKSLGLEYSESLNYIIENRDKVNGFTKDNDGLKFYKSQQVTVMAGSGQVNEIFIKEIKELNRHGVDTKDAVEIYKQVFKE